MKIARDMDVDVRGMTATLSQGDRITYGVTHQIKIGREDSWVKYEANSAVQEGETAEQAAERVMDHVNRTVMEAVMETVKIVEEHQ